MLKHRKIIIFLSILFCALGFIAIMYVVINQTRIIVVYGVERLRGIKSVILGIVVFSGGVLLAAVINYFSNKAKKDKLKNENLKQLNSASPIMFRQYKINQYLTENVSTEFFRNILVEAVLILENFGKKQNSLFSMLKKRFDTSTLSYNKFTAPIELLQTQVFNLIDGLLTRLDTFDESGCIVRIKLLEAKDRHDEANNLKSLYNDYVDYARNVDNVLNNALFRMDKLILEISKLSDNELQLAFESLKEMEDIISNVKFYQSDTDS